MRFICPELDKASQVKDLCKILNYSAANIEGNLYPLLYAFTDKGGENYYYGSNKIKKYLNVFHVDFVSRLVSEIATLIDLPVLTNFSSTESLKRIVMSAGELLKLKTEAWITIFTDQDIRFYKPERLDTSKAIASYKIIENYEQLDRSIGFQGETSGSIFTDLVVGDTLNPIVIDSEIKNMIVNAYTASADLIRFTSGMSANPLDYINDKGSVYLVISKREDNGIYYYTAIRESKISQTFTGGNVANPNLRTGGDVIFEQVLAADAAAFEIDGLDLAADGGEYEILLAGQVTAGTYLGLFYNDDEDVGNYYGIGHYGLYVGTNSVGSFQNGCVSYWLGEYNCTTKIHMERSLKIPATNDYFGQSAQAITNLGDSFYNMMSFWKSRDNITKIKLSCYNDGVFKAGSMIQIRMRQANATINFKGLSGIPAGGSEDQVLTKKSGTDYDTEWKDAGGSTGGLSQAQVLTRGLGA